MHRRPQVVEVYFFFVDQRFSRPELDTFAKDHDDQDCWSSLFAAAYPVNTIDFQR